jgi:hypothetical protein
MAFEGGVGYGASGGTGGGGGNGGNGAYGVGGGDLGTPSTEYLERAKSFAERIQATMTSAVSGDALYNTLAQSPMTAGGLYSCTRSMLAWGCTRCMQLPP